jgi:hypothetical protein
MNIQLSKTTLELLAKCTEAQTKLDAFNARPVDKQTSGEFTFLFETLSSNARMLAMGLQADKEQSI